MSKRTLVKTAKKWIRDAGYELRRRDRDLDVSHASALNHDDALTLLFRNIDPENFFFVQIGANDGRMQDPLYDHIRRYGLRGLLVEPQPAVFEKLKSNYADQPQLLFENCAIAPEKGEMTLYTLPDTLDFPEADKNFSGFASFNREHVIKGFNFHAPQVGLTGRAEDYLVTCRVAAMPFEALLQKHGIKRVDYVQIDTEGFDFEIIRMIDFEGHPPGAILYEHSGLSPEDKRACWEFLAERGYTCAVCGMDTLAYRK